MCDSTSLELHFGLTAVCVLFITGTVKLTSSFFPRLNFSSDTRILLLDPTVPDLIFKFMSLGSI